MHAHTYTHKEGSLVKDFSKMCQCHVAKQEFYYGPILVHYTVTLRKRKEWIKVTEPRQ